MHENRVSDPPERLQGVDLSTSGLADHSESMRAPLQSAEQRQLGPRGILDRPEGDTDSARNKPSSTHQCRLKPYVCTAAQRDMSCALCDPKEHPGPSRLGIAARSTYFTLFCGNSPSLAESGHAVSDVRARVSYSNGSGCSDR